MTTPFLRFLHSSDWHLEHPLSGLSEIPDHLRELLIEAPYLAAERVIETALSEKVDLVILAGDIVDPRRSGPVGPAFLLGQFERLRDRGIAVYWCRGATDRYSGWPKTILFPPNVHQFTSDEPLTLIFERDGTAVAQIQGAARRKKQPLLPHRFHPQPNLFSIGVAHGRIPSDDLAATGVNYWALGGRHKRHTLFASRRTAHYSGTPQGRSFAELGPHGCTLVDVPEPGATNSAVKTRSFVTDVVRWHVESILIEPGQGPGHLDRLVQQRHADLVAATPDSDLIILWKVTLRDRLPDADWRHMSVDLLNRLQTGQGFTSPIRWNAAIEFCAEPGVSLYAGDADNLLGDFLQEVARFQTDLARSLRTEDLSNPPAAEELLPFLNQVETQRRDRILFEAAALGADLLGESPPQESRR